MAIRRAGPFASSTDSFLDEPETPTIDTLPVNCAMSDWVNDSWRAAKRIVIDDFFDPTNTVTYEEGPTLEATFSNPGGANFGAAAIEFTYQAAEETSFTLTYSATGTDPIVSVVIDNSGVFSDTDPSSISGTETITLPATVVPLRVNANVFSESSGGGTVGVAP
jgi:hypothetical protein